MQAPVATRSCAFYEATMSRALLVLPLLLGGCAAATAQPWPSLATRPGEVQPLVPRPAVVAAADPSRPAAVTDRDAAARLASLERDITTLAARLTTQRETARAARGVAADGEAGAAAEIERSRTDRLTSQVSDLRDRLDALAGDLARQAASGGEVAPLLTRTGTAIERLEALR